MTQGNKINLQRDDNIGEKCVEGVRRMPIKISSDKIETGKETDLFNSNQWVDDRIC